MKFLTFLYGYIAIQIHSTATAFLTPSRSSNNVVVASITVGTERGGNHRSSSSTSNRSSSRLFGQSRRDVLSKAGSTFGGIVTSQLLPWGWESSSTTATARATDMTFSTASSTSLPSGLLDSRVQGNVLAPPPYGMEGPDIFYPEWFSGTWKVISETKEIQAPCGVALFGGNATYTNALKDVGNILRYDSRFIRDGTGRIIADREYNVKSIVKVAMGENSVVDVTTSTPNKFSCLLAPKGAPSMMRVDLIVLNRRQEEDDVETGQDPENNDTTNILSRYQFDCSEVVREIVSSVDRPISAPPPSPILKEIETTSLYTYDPIKDVVRCRQRSAAFLLPSNENPIAMKMWQASGGKAIDVRFYDVLYVRS